MPTSGGIPIEAARRRVFARPARATWRYAFMWQLLKALAEQGVELVVAPYQGPSIETPWWTGAANPCQLEGDVVAWLKHVAPSPRPRVAALDDSAPDRLTRGIVERVTKPRWRKHLMGLIEQVQDVDYRVAFAQ